MYRPVENTALTPNRHSAGMRCVEEVATISTERFIPNGMKNTENSCNSCNFVDKKATISERRPPQNAKIVRNAKKIVAAQQIFYAFGLLFYLL
jgi:hypothetical protein